MRVAQLKVNFPHSREDLAGLLLRRVPLLQARPELFQLRQHHLGDDAEQRYCDECSTPHLALQQRREAIVSAILEGNRRAALSIWAPRAFPTALGTANLRAYNEAFLQLLDIPAPLQSPINELHFTQARPQIKQEATREVTESLEQFMAAVDELHKGGIQGAHGVSAYVSPLGCTQFRYVALVGLFDKHGMLLEWICSMTPLSTSARPHLEMVRSRPSCSRALHSSPLTETRNERLGSVRQQAKYVFVIRRTQWIQVPLEQLKRKRHPRDS